ncbi:MAG: S9 family peptidase [Cytophagales bacterium]|nr:MAG: S9 family peptidase [Cytophagales bacterium]TAF59809.1 MAG: S9 family peptidase [Cytophagales bacterium]
MLFKKAFLVSLFFCVVLGVSLAHAQNVPSLAQIMNGHDFVGNLPQEPFFSEDGSKIYFKWTHDLGGKPQLFAQNLKNNQPEGKPYLVSSDEKEQMVPLKGSYDINFKNKVFESGGDLYLYNTDTKQKFRLCQTLDYESNPSFDANGTKIFYEKNNNLHVFNRQSGFWAQLTNLKEGHKSSTQSLTAAEEWLVNEEKRLIKAHANALASEPAKPKWPKPFFLGDLSAYDFSPSPSGKFVVFNAYKSLENKATAVPHYVPKSGFTVDLETRAKVGQESYLYESFLFDVEKDTVYKLSFSSLPGIQNQPAYYKEYGYSYTKSDRPVVPTQVLWSSNSQYALMDVRSQDNKDRWIVLLQLENGKLETLLTQHDEAWIGGPGINEYEERGTIGFLADNETFFYQSEESGYSHVYTYHLPTRKAQVLTEGLFEVSDLQLSKGKQFFYFSANKNHPGEHQFYRMAVKGGEMIQITQKEGIHQVVMSPDERLLADRYSFMNKPWELYLQENKAQASSVQLTNSLTEEFKKYTWHVPEIVTFKANDGANVYARLYRKAGRTNGKAVIFVHGAGYLQNVHKGWSHYFREYMFHNLLIDKGYTVLDIDYRASEGYGQKWRTGIYRHMGGLDLSDHVDGVKFLTEKCGVDAKRVGIYGGSYGGFITLMALFKHPDVFKAGAALRSVTDWAHYNHGYTSNILNTPVLDPEAFRKSSPIYFAEGLKGDLLICHGIIDTNVHFQDVVRLSQRLIDLGKTNWEMAVYPLEDHGFVYNSSWYDEYRRIFELFERVL